MLEMMLALSLLLVLQIDHYWTSSLLELFAVAGQSYQAIVDPGVILIMGIIIGVVSLSALVVVKKKRGGYKTKKYGKLVGERPD